MCAYEQLQAFQHAYCLPGRPQRWLILSLGRPWPLSSLCAPHALSAAAPATAISLVYLPKPGYQPQDGAELAATSVAQLAALISTASADHVFAVQPPTEQPPGPGSPLNAGDRGRGMRDAFGDASMLWAFQAHSAARTGARLSLVTYGAHGLAPAREGTGTGVGSGLLGGPLCGNVAAAAALALARTQWMEARPGAGPALDIWPPAALPTLQVGIWLHPDYVPRPFNPLNPKNCPLECMQPKW